MRLFLQEKYEILKVALLNIVQIAEIAKFEYYIIEEANI
jgi:hypothetical protein